MRHDDTNYTATTDPNDLTGSVADRLRAFLRSFELEEGGTLDCVESRLSHSTLYWGEWNGRKMVMIELDEHDPYAPLSVVFSLDLAHYEVADFARRFEADVGPWNPVSNFFLAVPEPGGVDRIVHGDRASIHRAFRDCGLVMSDSRKGLS